MVRLGDAEFSTVAIFSSISYQRYEDCQVGLVCTAVVDTCIFVSFFLFFKKDHSN